MSVRIGHLGPVHFDNASARLDQAASEQAALPERVLTIPSTEGFRFALQIERVASLAAEHQAQCLAVIVLQFELLGGFFELGHSLGNCLTEAGPAIEANLVDVGSKLQILGLDPGH